MGRHSNRARPRSRSPARVCSKRSALASCDGGGGGYSKNGSLPSFLPSFVPPFLPSSLPFLPSFLPLCAPAAAPLSAPPLLPAVTAWEWATPRRPSASVRRPRPLSPARPPASCSPSSKFEPLSLTQPLPRDSSLSSLSIAQADIDSE